ncbi:MAG TPA: regulator [Candidatus Agrococcus pullicola]|uniref:Regulator n=1 Tax=Candidatus Agrococcus pullicola TaxID=2838429 RepID=A0A9D2C985_9MICO|nr:regulator [Candidatus Agrococcus pullicola]
MIVFALALDLELEERVAAEAVSHGHDVAIRAGSPAELIGRLGTSRVDLVLVGASERLLTSELLSAADAAGIRILALAKNPHERERARGMGVQVTEHDAGFEQISRLCEGPLPEEAEPERGSVVTVWGTHGAPGRTTAAIGIASELAAGGASCALVDADTYAASVAPALALLDESPGFAAAARLAKQGSLTVAELDRVAATHETDGHVLSVLTGISRSDRWPELAGDRVANVLAECRSWKRFTVVDVAASVESDDLVSSDMHAPRRNAATIAALQAADTVVAVAGADPVGMTRFLRAYPELADIVDPRRIRVVVNGVRIGTSGLAPQMGVTETLERFASVTPSGLWPLDRSATDAALLAGQTLREAAPRSLLRRRVTETAQELLPEEERMTRRARRESRAPTRRRLPLPAWIH